MRPSPRLSVHYLDRRGTQLGLLAAVTALLQLAAGTGLAYTVGFSRVAGVIQKPEPRYLLPLLAALVVSFVGYYFAYRGIYRIEGGPDLPGSHMRAVVTAGFGGFLAHGGSALDAYALQAAGSDERDAKVRVTCLGGMEHGILSLIGTAAAIAVLAAGYPKPPLDFTLPWAVLPVPGFLLAFWLAERYRDRLREAPGWRGKVGIFCDAIHLVRVTFRHPVRWAGVLLGLTAFWLAECLAGWAGVAFFGFHMNWARFVIGFGTGMVFTRRTGPFAGAGVLELVLPLSLWASGAPLPVAILGLFLYRAVSIWLPMPLALGRLRTLRQMGEGRVPGTRGTASPPGEPALQRNPA
jgi:uncharacterized membrane protein YbhN (UPF0104 family)